MGLCLSTGSRLQVRSTERIGQGTICGVFHWQSSRASIHILDDDLLLKIFYFCRPFFLGEDEDGMHALRGGVRPWKSWGRWWYRLSHVCQRWRNLTLGSPYYLGLSLVCTSGTPVENMLAHSPPLPLTIDYGCKDGTTAEDEEGILLALKQRHRVRHLRLTILVQDLWKLVTAIDGEFPILEYLIIDSSVKDNMALMLPETLQVPNLRHLALSCFTYPIRSQLLVQPTTENLGTLLLMISHESTYFQPDVLLQWISFMPRLECFGIGFKFPVPNRDVERQLTHPPFTTHITLPNLHTFRFRGVSAYLEAVVCRITAPRLERLRIRLFEQLTFSVPHLAQFINTAENLRFTKAGIIFEGEQIVVGMLSHGTMCPFGVTVDCQPLAWQVSSMVQICNSLSQVFSTVEHLSVRHEAQGRSFEEHNDVDRIQWRKLFKLFCNAKRLDVQDGFVKDVSRCLRLEDGELPLELLSELQELQYFGSGDADDAFTSFIDSRQNAGCPVTLVRHIIAT